MDKAAIKRLRKRLGLTQVQLAKRLGVHPMTISRWERGEVRVTEPMSRLLKMLAKG